jgi:hypothetical protein
MPTIVVRLHLGWRNWFGKHSLDVWNLVPLCMMWNIWLERNSRTSVDMESPVSQITEVFIGSIFDWS